MRPPGDHMELAADRAIHVVGIAMGLAGAVALMPLAVVTASVMGVVAAALYAASLMAMLGCSAAYNLALPSPRRLILRRLDHAAVFLLIAGTYSPFTLGRLDGAWSVWLAGVVWMLALLGAAAKFAFPHRFERLYVVAYLGLGWAVLLAIDPLLASLGPTTVALIAAGGLLYSIGVVFHLWRGLRFHNAIWHGFVLSAAVCHYAAVVTSL